MALPILFLRGGPFEQGLAHGRELRDRIAHNLEVYLARFSAEGRLSRDEVLRRAGAYGKAIAKADPDYDAALRGVAEGGGFDPGLITALNVRYEILYHQIHVNAGADGCTSFAVAPGSSANGHLWIGQNWDWIPEVKGAVIRTSAPGGLETIGFTEAGIVGEKIGLNSAGVGLVVNGLTTTSDDWARLRRPFHARCRRILRSPDFDSAVRVVTGEERSCSTNYLIAQAPGRAADLEAAPEGARRIEFEDGRIVHANHFLEPGPLGIAEPQSGGRPHSCRRHDRLRELLASRRPLGLADFQEFLRDHRGRPYSVCRHVDEQGPQDLPFVRRISVVSAVMDLDARTLWISDGPPCENPYVEIGFD